jgi:serralysin
MATFTAGVFGVDFDYVDLGSLASGVIQNPSSGSFDIVTASEATHVFGAGFVFGADGAPLFGTVDHIRDDVFGTTAFDLGGISVSAATLLSWIATGANETAKAAIFAGADNFQGSGVADVMRGYAGDDRLDGGAGDDRLFGDDGADTVVDTTGSNYLRGGAGDDLVMGGDGFDDTHGNIGNDTVHGGGFDDWVVGGQGNDMLFGDDGSDLCYGNLGEDTIDGGAGDDGVVGGQANDMLNGGAGSDFITGDRGDDTLTGGTGADRFHFSAISANDRVLDFNYAEGDRILIDAGLTYTVSDVGGSAMLSISGGAQVVLVGVPMSALTADAIIVG